MRIAFAVPSVGLQEGQGNVNLELLRRVLRAGHRVDLFAGIIPEVVTSMAGVRAHRIPRLPAWQLGNQIISLAAAGAALRPARYDVVHADAGVMLRTADVMVCHTVTARWFDLPPQVWREPGLRGANAYAATRLKARLEIEQYRRAGFVFANSEMTARDLVARGVAAARVGVLPLGIDAERFRPPTPDERAGARAALGLPVEGDVVLLVGAHGPRKGLPLLLDVIEAASPRPHLLVAGEHRGGAWARDARARGLPVVMPGKLPDVRRAYWAADLLAYPTRYDAFGMAVLEAMACGLPVVVSSDAGASEIVTDAGIVLDRHEVDPWGRAIAGLLADRGRRDAMGARGRQIALQRDWDIAGDMLLNRYADSSGSS